MVKITRVYTRTGDKGTTQLAQGQRVAKTCARIDAIGCVDELNASLGLAIALLPDQPALASLRHELLHLQNQLFDLGAGLAVLAADKKPTTPALTPHNITYLEQSLDRMNATLSPLPSFILPGGGCATAALHVARTVCRRAERALWHLHANEPLTDTDLSYLNRLSDWLFVAARFTAHELGEREDLWQPASRS